MALNKITSVSSAKTENLLNLYSFNNKWPNNLYMRKNDTKISKSIFQIWVVFNMGI